MDMAEAKKKTETIRLFSDSGKYKGDLFVSVNGVNYQLQRGKNIEVPPEVAEVIRHSQEQDDQTAARMEELAELQAMGCHAAILGKSIYTGAIDLKQAVALYQE